jgi:hypothetical protein
LPGRIDPGSGAWCGGGPSMKADGAPAARCQVWSSGRSAGRDCRCWRDVSGGAGGGRRRRWA